MLKNIFKLEEIWKTRKDIKKKYLKTTYNPTLGYDPFHYFNILT